MNLLRQALAKIPLLPFSLALEKWRWDVMSGRIQPDNYNQAWWNFKLKYQGLFILTLTPHILPYIGTKFYNKVSISKQV